MVLPRLPPSLSSAFMERPSGGAHEAREGGVWLEPGRSGTSAHSGTLEGHSKPPLPAGWCPSPALEALSGLPEGSDFP